MYQNQLGSLLFVRVQVFGVLSGPPRNTLDVHLITSCLILHARFLWFQIYGVRDIEELQNCICATGGNESNDILGISENCQPFA